MAAKKKRIRNTLISSQFHGKGTMYTYETKSGTPKRAVHTPFGTRHETIWFKTAAERDRARKAAIEKEYGPLRRDLKKNPAKWAPYLKKAAALEKLAKQGGATNAQRLSMVGIGEGTVADLRKRAAAFRAEALRLKAEGKKKNPTKPKRKATAKRKRNGSELGSAAKMFKKFTGKQATKVKTVAQLRVTPSVLADCGKLVDLVVATDKGAGVRLTFGGGVRLGVTGNGGQLYFVGCDQAVDLGKFPHASPLKDQVDLGEAVSICYETSKDFHNFEKSDYEHEFGEEGGARPLLAYDVRSKRLYLVGGDYIVKRPGIID